MRMQEDRFAFEEKCDGNNFPSFYAVFDGHAGYQAAQYCKENLAGKLKE
jgi:serine/threonine protein phosphatase PrpC